MANKTMTVHCDKLFFKNQDLWGITFGIKQPVHIAKLKGK